MIKRINISIKGIVQGVGFRPFVFRLAGKHCLTGSIRNSLDGVEIEIQGLEKNIKGFLRAVREEAPVISRISQFHTREIGLNPAERDFVINKSVSDGNAFLDICPDITLCSHCIKEMLDDGNRRYMYPFINCTNCGPRYTIIKRLPYDRPNTTMKSFSMCKECSLEYRDSKNRRFHAQPVSCHACGPGLHTLAENIPENIIEYAIDLLKKGEIIAIKGIGGFHLACDAFSDEPVARLRRYKARDNKPFAVMFPDISHAKAYACLDQKAEEILSSSASPVVIAEKRKKNDISEYISPNINTYGIILPYSPLHFLLFFYKNPKYPHFKALVMTSANRASKPVIKDEREIIKSDDNIPYDIISHNRDIENRIDDSVLRPCRNGIIMLRRSRGYAPFSMQLPGRSVPALCTGGEMKNTIALANSDKCYISPYIGDLKDIDTFEYMIETKNKMSHFYGIFPERIVYDSHPLYVNTKWARASGIEALAVQHHCAHIASVAGEKEYFDDVIGIAMDGSGYGDDGNLWGGEFFTGSPLSCRRAGHLAYTKIQGGGIAPKEPYRTAVSYLYGVYGDRIHDLDIPLLKRDIPGERISLIIQGLERNINTFYSSSIGRLFDAAASISGLRHNNSYEGQSAVEFESMLENCINLSQAPYSYFIENQNGVYTIDAGGVIEGLVTDTASKRDISLISCRFHNTVTDIILKMCRILRQDTGLSTVMLSGGVFQNRYLRESAESILYMDGFIPWFNNTVSPGDEGISYGQAVINSLR